MRVILLWVWVAFLLPGQEPKKAAETVPVDRRADTYAVYSAVLNHPSLSHPDNNEKYLVRDWSDVSMEKEPGNCIEVPEAYRVAYSELLQDRNEHRKAFLLERAFEIAKPYNLITEEQAHQFGKLRLGPGSNTQEVELFRGATDLITLGNVYFDRKRTVAATYTAAYCGSLCGFWTWRVFVKNGKGDWAEQHWTRCMTIAGRPAAAGTDIRPYRCGEPVGQAGDLPHKPQLYLAATGAGILSLVNRGIIRSRLATYQMEAANTMASPFTSSGTIRS